RTPDTLSAGRCAAWTELDGKADFQSALDTFGYTLRQRPRPLRFGGLAAGGADRGPLCPRPAGARGRGIPPARTRNSLILNEFSSCRSARTTSDARPAARQRWSGTRLMSTKPMFCLVFFCIDAGHSGLKYRTK